MCRSRFQAISTPHLQPAAGPCAGRQPAAAAAERCVPPARHATGAPASRRSGLQRGCGASQRPGEHAGVQGARHRRGCGLVGRCTNRWAAPECWQNGEPARSASQPARRLEQRRRCRLATRSAGDNAFLCCSCAVSFAWTACSIWSSQSRLRMQFSFAINASPHRLSYEADKCVCVQLDTRRHQSKRCACIRRGAA